MYTTIVSQPHIIIHHKQKTKNVNSFFFYKIFAVVSKFVSFLIFYIEEVRMSIKYILVVLEMLYRIKKIEKPSYYCEMRPKTKKWCETYDGHCRCSDSMESRKLRNRYQDTISIDSQGGTIFCPRRSAYFKSENRLFFK